MNDETQYKDDDGEAAPTMSGVFEPINETFKNRKDLTLAKL